MEVMVTTGAIRQAKLQCTARRSSWVSSILVSDHKGSWLQLGGGSPSLLWTVWRQYPLYPATAIWTTNSPCTWLLFSFVFPWLVCQRAATSTIFHCIQYRNLQQTQYSSEVGKNTGISIIHCMLRYILSSVLYSHLDVMATAYSWDYEICCTCVCYVFNCWLTNWLVDWQWQNVTLSHCWSHTNVTDVLTQGRDSGGSTGATLQQKAVVTCFPTSCRWRSWAGGQRAPSPPARGSGGAQHKLIFLQHLA